MSGTAEVSQEDRLSSNSIIAVIGFSLYIVWALFVCFWLSGSVDAQVGFETSTLNRLAAFMGFPVGFLAIAILAKSPKFNVFDNKILIVIAALTALLPTACVATSVFCEVPSPLSFACILISAAAGTFVQICWLDVLSRFELSNLGTSTGVATLVGALIFLLVSSMPSLIQDITACVCILASIGLVAYASRVAPYNKDRAPLEKTQDRWRFTREIEPSLIIFGMIFSLSFFYLMKAPALIIVLGIIGIALGGIVAVAADLSKHVFRITSVQRLIMVITVTSCLLMWIENEPLRIVVSLVSSASCSFLVIANSIFLIRKICTPRDIPVFRSIPKRLMIFSSGFALGWLMAAIVIMIPDSDPQLIGYLRLGLAIALTVVMMLYLPVEKHHDDTASAAGGHTAYTNNQIAAAVIDQSAPVAIHEAITSNMSHPVAESVGQSGVTLIDPPPVAPAGVSISESEAFDAKCEEIASLYQLSPREAEILPFLARGRNNAYLQKRFVISPHTAKSHIYNIYRKMDIHSQQKLMDFVEEFPEDYEQKA